ncbi:NitT/TauT family transport system permease protein [Hypnocyclicus thermotrophus]|uniref:NitT/TauT family transport system permease protein n=1 Tax=Hypnocyclicus thermotrophus TaxID=1627895 RepID=A0AA46DYE7_9FUSO|nr:ABC transporter permease subunit [Hypnocyclicus thermotrophus]TDT69707.1 NitT/TauT family transport system permease protein [Hypnocyclicus thermotrophus]
MKTFITKIIKKKIIILSWILIWGLIAKIVNNSILIPSPIETFKTLLSLVNKANFWYTIFFTVYRVLIGVLLSIFLGTFLSIFAIYSKILKDFFEPIITAIKSTPVMSFIVIALVWFKSGIVPIFINVLVCFPIIYTNILEGINSIDKKILNMAKLYKVKNIYIIKDIYIPATKNFLASGIIMSLGLGFKVTIASEILSVPRYSIGLNLLESKTLLETQELFAWTIIIVFLSLLFEGLFKFYLKYKRGNFKNE